MSGGKGLQARIKDAALDCYDSITNAPVFEAERRVAYEYGYMMALRAYHLDSVGQLPDELDAIVLGVITKFVGEGWEA